MSMFFSKSDGIATEIYLTEKQTEFYSRENRPCKRYNPGEDRISIKKDSIDFIKCSKENIWKTLKIKINCSIIGLEPFFDHPNEMRECQSIDEAWSTFSAATNIFTNFQSARDGACTLPCVQVTLY